LIEVKGISKNLNLFFPGIGNKGKQQKQKQERENRTETLVPSICHNFKFPADYWMKALLLPSVCHRMHYLFHHCDVSNLPLDVEIYSKSI
jgi:endoribonuclease Dicer